MSDSKPSFGEPVEEPHAGDDDVVGSAHEGIADAEAAGRDAVASDDASGTDQTRDAASEPVAETSRDAAPARDAASDDSFDSSLYEAHADDTATPWEPPAETAVAATPAFASTAPAANEPAWKGPAANESTTVEPITPSEPVADTVVAPAGGDAYDGGAYAGGAYAAGAAASAPAYGGPQPIFVQAPEAPRPRGNRGAAGAIGLLAALSFGVLYLAVAVGIGMLDGGVTVENLGSTALAALGTWSFWVPVVVFFIAFWLLGAIINRGRWGAWVIFGLLVGVAAYLGHILGALFQAPFWMLTASEGAALVESQWLAPLAIAAFIIGRELSIWFGAWVASRGARVNELNVEAQREYERTLEAGPQLTRV